MKGPIQIYMHLPRSALNLAIFDLRNQCRKAATGPWRTVVYDTPWTQSSKCVIIEFDEPKDAFAFKLQYGENNER